MAEIQPHVSAVAAERRQSAPRVTSRSARFTWPRNLASVGDSASPRAVTDPHQGTAGEVVQGQPQQGINEAAEAIARVCDHDRRFKRRLHTAWDNLGQGQVFLRRPATRLIVHMLVGYDLQETMERVPHRCQWWALQRYSEFIPWENSSVIQSTPKTSVLVGGRIERLGN